jgi:FHA domain-containing protein
MGPLAAVERFLERLFERQSARLFRTAIRPVQVQRRLERAMEGERIRDGGRTIVPHRFVVRLHGNDLAALRATAPGLAATLADGALGFARSHGYTLLDRPVVVLRADPSVAAGDIAVDALDPHREPPVEDGSAVDDVVDDMDAGADLDPGSPDGAPPDGRQHAPALPASSSGEAARAIDQTAVFVRPGIDGPRATIREIRPDRSSRSIAFDGRPLTIGRAPDNGVVLRDGRASRHHARIDARRGSLVLSDLGSTNGSFVNDRRVESIALGEGDRIRVGTTTLLIEAIASGAPDAASSADAIPGGPASGGAPAG